MPISKVDEGKRIKIWESETDSYEQQYEELFNEVAKSDLFTKSGRSFTRMDSHNLGAMLGMYKQYEEYVNETASASDLGTLPSVATDLIAATYAVSIAPLIASIQTIPEEQGIIWYKQVVTDAARANRASGDVWANATQGIVNGLDQYSGEKIENERLGTTTSSAGPYSLQTTAYPIRSNVPVVVNCPAITGATGVFLNGILMSAGGVWTGTLDYTSGAIAITFASAPSSGKDIFLTYYQDFEKATDIPSIDMMLTSTDVKAEVLALKQTIGTLKSFQFSQRFGRVAEDEALMDLAGALADVESRKVIKTWKYMADWVEVNCPNAAITYAVTNPSTYYSEYEYKQSFRYRLAEADKAININSGRGAANRYIAGHSACIFLESLPGFVKAATNIAVGPHVYGYYKGAPVIRTIYVDTNEILAGYLNPQSPFEAPAVLATYMPVFVTNTMQMGTNPLMNQRAIASWKSWKGVVPQFVKRIRLTA